MSKKTIKLISAALTIAIVTMLLTTTAFAVEIGGVEVNPNTSAQGATNVQNVGNNILGIIQVVGTIIAIGILMVLGIKYMMGSAEEKAEYKKTMIPYIVGAILIFAATFIVEAIYQFANNV